MSTLTYLLVATAVLAVMLGRAECRPHPQTPDATDVETGGGDGGNTGGDGDEGFFLGFPPGQFGSVVGEVRTYTDPLPVSKRNKKKQRQEEQNGPSASAFVSGPQEASVGVSAGISFVPSQAKVELVSAR